MTDKYTPTPDSEDDELRFAPALEPDSASAEMVTDATSEPAMDSPPVDDLLESLPAAELDLDAALAAVASLDDMLAEQEAAEMAEQARQQAEAEAQAQAEARLQHPEMFFAMPPLEGLQRGRLDSVVPALVLILGGAWLTYTLTTTGILAPFAIPALLAGGITLTLLARWLATGRWATGNLFFALLILIKGGTLAGLLLTENLSRGWPLLIIGTGLAFLLTGLAAHQARLSLPGPVIMLAGVVVFMSTHELLPTALIAPLSVAWPAVVLVVALILLLPLIFRRQRTG